LAYFLQKFDIYFQYFRKYIPFFPNISFPKRSNIHYPNSLTKSQVKRVSNANGTILWYIDVFWQMLIVDLTVSNVTARPL